MTTKEWADLREGRRRDGLAISSPLPAPPPAGDPSLATQQLPPATTQLDLLEALLRQTKSLLDRQTVIMSTLLERVNGLTVQVAALAKFTEELRDNPERLPALLTRRLAAAYLSVSRDRFQQLWKAGKLPGSAVRVGDTKQSVRFRRIALDRAILRLPAAK